MNRNVMPAGKCKGILEAISSKSHVHRLLIAAALADGESVIETNIISEDMQATMDCLTALGAEIQVKENGIATGDPIVIDFDVYTKSETDNLFDGITSRLETLLCYVNSLK